MSITFGPVPSRRLGRSLGINNIPPKICTYSCVYCQLGRTHGTTIQRTPMYAPSLIHEEVDARVRMLRTAGEPVEYLTFVPDGEPTMDANLGNEIQRLRDLSIPIAVITNSSLLWQPELREELNGADLVSLKIDTVRHRTWKRINRPHPALFLEHILEGIRLFSKSFHGTIYTETMLVQGVNDTEEEMEGVAEELAVLHPDRAYLSIPIRPPAERWVVPPSEEDVTMAYQIFREKVEEVECLTGMEDPTFLAVGDAEEDLLRITAVHPMREEAVRAFLQRAGGEWSIVEQLLQRGELVEVSYRGQRFFLRAIP
jgi:wyosine [tRNA(Phe)-imidazoG37] synthetase (radical SAM superfamily)